MQSAFSRAVFVTSFLKVRIDHAELYLRNELAHH
jgi:hypothetical protein